MSSNIQSARPRSLEIAGPLTDELRRVLTPEAQAFVAVLADNFGGGCTELLARRARRQIEFDRGVLPDFLKETANIRENDWTVAEIPPALRDRRVEITGPVDRKMIINALNSGVKVFMADFEDSNSPTWDNIINGQLNLRDAVNRTISFTNPHGKQTE